MKLPNLLPNWISNRVADPEGTAPKGLVFKSGVILLALLMAVVIFLAPSEETSSEQTAAAPALPPPAGPSAVAKGDQDIQSATDRRNVEQSRAARRKREAVDRARQFEEQFLREQAELETEAAENRKAIAAARQQNLTVEEELHQNIRLQRIQREDNSLRSSPVALSFRSAESQARPILLEPGTTPPAAAAPRPPAPAPAPQPTPATVAEQALQEGDVAAATRQPLSATFDRLIFDNYNIRMPFAGLKDQVKRHYLATFGAAGAVGVISGLTLRNTQSSGFNVPAGQAARMEAGRSLGESTSSIMNQYLNRLPTIIIRAGHRIRIYFVSDLLVPRRPS